MTLVELMVGLAVGMIVVAGAVVMATSQIGEHKRLIQETQVQQDLRAAADMMLRELRRAGSWRSAEASVWTPNNTAPLSNPYSAASAAVSVSPNGDEVTYSYSDPTTAEDDIASNSEKHGFMLVDGILKYRMGGTYQPLTDAATLTVDAFEVQLNTQALALPDYCEQPCAGLAQCPPSLLVQDVLIRIKASAAKDKDVSRTLTLRARVRNDQVTGVCP